MNVLGKSASPESGAPHRPKFLSSSSWSPRNMGFAAAALLLTGCPEGNQNPPGPQVPSPSQSAQVSSSHSPEAASTTPPPPLTEAEARRERLVFVSLIGFASKARKHLLELRKTEALLAQQHSPEERDKLEKQYTFRSIAYNLESLTGFRLISKLPPRSWPRGMTAFSNINVGKVDPSKAASMSPEDFGPLAHTERDTLVEQARKVICLRMTSLMASLVLFFDIDIAALEKKIINAGDTDTTQMRGKLMRLKVQRAEFIQPLTNGRLLKAHPSLTADFAEMLLKEFIQVRKKAGGPGKDDPSTPSQIRFGSGDITFDELMPDFQRWSKPRQPHGPVLPSPPKEKPEPPDNSPQNASPEAPEGLETQVVLMMGLLHASQMHRLG